MRVSGKIVALLLFLPPGLPLAASAQEPYFEEFPPETGIALFSGRNFSGEVREAFDPFVTLHDLAFNDRSRSVAVLSGQWELCEHVNFTGRCVFVREDIADLNWFGLSGRITSIRPVYEYTLAQHGLMFTRDEFGHIRYVHDESYGYGGWRYGYASSWRVGITHYGYSPDYWRYGYYDPVWGYDPYGFAWTRHGRRVYPARYYQGHPRPVTLNLYWKRRGKDHHDVHRGGPGHDRDRRRGDRDPGREDGWPPAGEPGQRDGERPDWGRDQRADERRFPARPDDFVTPDGPPAGGGRWRPGEGSPRDQDRGYRRRPDTGLPGDSLAGAPGEERPDYSRLPVPSAPVIAPAPEPRGRRDDRPPESGRRAGPGTGSPRAPSLPPPSPPDPPARMVRPPAEASTGVVTRSPPPRARETGSSAARADRGRRVED